MRKISSEEFNNIILKKDYLFHFHTVYTDGKSTVREYFDFAFRNNVHTLIFTEHVRKKTSYNFNELLEDINNAQRFYPNIKVIIGVEAKILPESALDIPEKILDEIQLICFACHSFSDNIVQYQKSFEKLFYEKKWENYIRVWVHPGRFLKRRNLLKTHITVLKNLLELAEKEGILIEYNLKEQLPPHKIISFYDRQKILVGCDAHSVKEIPELNKYKIALDYVLKK